MSDTSRREFLKTSICAASALGVGAAFAGVLPTSAAPAALAIKKGVLLDMLPASLSYADRFKMARDVGFEVVQAPTTPDQATAEQIKKASDGASIRIDSVMNMDHW